MVFLQEPIVLYDSSGRIAAEIAQVIDASLNDRLDGTLTLSFTSKVERVPEITPETSIAFRGQYYRATQVQSSASGGAFLLLVSCEQESISLVDYKIEEFNFTGSADDALARLLDGTGITATAEHTGTITISAQGGNRRSVLLEIVKLCEGELEYQGHHIRIVNRRGNGDPIDIVRVCRCTDCVKTLNLRDGSEGYELSGVTAEGYGVGDKVILDFAPLGIHVQKRVVGVSYNPFNCTGVSVEIGEYITDITEDYAQLEKIFLLKADASIEFDKYINSAEGKAGIEAALSGSFVTKDALNGYVQTSELDAEIGAYLNGEEGIASITSAVSGKFVTPEDLSGYAKTSEVSSQITQEVNNGIASLRLSATETTTTETKEVDVGELVTNESIIGDDNTAMYDFSAKDSDGYYTSQNKGVAYSCSYAIFRFEFTQQTQVIFRCICRGESIYDYALISVVDTYLNASYLPDDIDGSNYNQQIINSDVFYSFRNNHSSNPVDVTMTIPSGEHYVTIKYVKDSGTNNTGDYFEFRAFVMQKETTSTGSTIELTQNGVTISSANIAFKGYVTFESLSTPGATTIDGANIKAGTITADSLKVQKVWYYDAYNKNDYMLITSEASGINTFTKIGPYELGGRGTNLNDWMQSLELYGNPIYFGRPGYNARNDGRALIIDVHNREIRPANGSGTWDIGLEDYPFSDLYLYADLNLYDSCDNGMSPGWTRLYTDERHLYWKDADGNEHQIV